MVYDPYEHAEELGIEVRVVPLRTANGYWYPDHNVIALRSGMKARYLRSTLAHEIAHALLGHVDQTRKNEVMADRCAAENLIGYDQCLDAMKWANDFHQLALELDVTPRLLRVYLNVHDLARLSRPTA